MNKYKPRHMKSAETCHREFLGSLNRMVDEKAKRDWEKEFKKKKEETDSGDSSTP